MEDYCSPPPPLSLSAPELNATMPEAPLMRYAASSTELLYERAMARFYKAVEIEQHETARRRSMSVDVEARRRSMSYDQDPKIVIQPNLRQEPTKDNSSLLKRRFSDDNNLLNLKIKLPKKLDSLDDDQSIDDQNEETHRNTMQNEFNTPDMIDNVSSPIINLKKDENFEEDYTASTVSSDEGGYDFEVDDVPTRRSKHRGQDTYHPPRMLSPYRQPDNSEAVAVLTKPLVPLPDPNFKPKPILKRPASADGRRNAPSKLDDSLVFGRRSVSPSPLTLTQRQHRKSVEIDVVPKIMFENDTKDVKVETKKEEEKVVQPPPVEVKVEPEIEEIDPELEYKRELARQRSEEQAKKMLQLRQSSLEENRAIADFYGDIIRDVSRPIVKPKVPIYMDPEALKKLQTDDDDEEDKNDSGITSSNDVSPPSISSRPFSPVKEIKNTTKAFSPPPIISAPKPTVEIINKMKPIELDETDNIDKEKLMNEIQTRGRAIVPKSVATSTIMKKRDQSHSRTRDSSVARQELAAKNPAESTILRRREKSLSRTRNRSESKSPSAMNRKIIINKVVHPKVALEVPVPPPRPLTPVEQQEEVDRKVKSSLTNITDVTILIFAAYLYFFKSALLALPILMLLIYRQISDKLTWFKRKKS